MADRIKSRISGCHLEILQCCFSRLNTSLIAVICQPAAARSPLCFIRRRCHATNDPVAPIPRCLCIIKIPENGDPSQQKRALPNQKMLRPPRHRLPPSPFPPPPRCSPCLPKSCLKSSDSPQLRRRNSRNWRCCANGSPVSSAVFRSSVLFRGRRKDGHYWLRNFKPLD